MIHTTFETSLRIHLASLQPRQSLSRYQCSPTRCCKFTVALQPRLLIKRKPDFYLFKPLQLLLPALGSKFLSQSRKASKNCSRQANSLLPTTLSYVRHFAMLFPLPSSPALVRSSSVCKSLLNHLFLRAVCSDPDCFSN